MAWLEVAFELKATKVNRGTKLLESMDALAISFYDAKDNPIFEPPPLSRPILWENSILVGLFDETRDIIQIERDIKSRFPDAEVKVKSLAEENWVAICQAQFPAQQYGNLWVCPSWAEKPSLPDAVTLELDPGMAFGTGTHATTHLCLQWLSSADLKNKDVIDFGCGSGILGLAAGLLGAKKVWAIDHDPQALISTTDNRDKNGLSADSLSVHAPDDALLDGIQADVLLANILAKPLIMLKDLFCQYLKQDGVVVLSGILTTQKQEVCDAYEQHFTLTHSEDKEDWSLLVYKKK